MRRFKTVLAAVCVLIPVVWLCRNDWKCVFLQSKNKNVRHCFDSWFHRKKQKSAVKTELYHSISIALICCYLYLIAQTVYLMVSGIYLYQLIPYVIIISEVFENVNKREIAQVDLKCANVTLIRSTWPINLRKFNIFTLLNKSE